MLTKALLIVMFAALPTGSICKIHKKFVPASPAFLNTQITDTLKLFVGGDLNFTERAQTLVSSLVQAISLEATSAHMRHVGKRAFSENPLLGRGGAERQRSRGAGVGLFPRSTLPLKSPLFQEGTIFSSSVVPQRGMRGSSSIVTARFSTPTASIS